jgi:hypothetical protein
MAQLFESSTHSELSFGSGINNDEPDRDDDDDELSFGSGINNDEPDRDDDDDEPNQDGPSEQQTVAWGCPKCRGAKGGCGKCRSWASAGLRSYYVDCDGCIAHS